MAITFQKQPLNFFNVNEPAIFEFTSDEDLGVNPNDLVADLELKSLWGVRRYVIKNIPPKYGTGVFRVDVSGYLKSLQLDNFNYDYNALGGRLATIERYQIGVSIHAENSSDIFADSYVFDSGYIFDETFIFAEASPNDTITNDDFYPIIGMTYRSETPKPAKSIDHCNILQPKYVEYASGFLNTISIFVADPLDGEPKNLIVDGATVTMPTGKGVRTVGLSEAQIGKMYLPTLITTTFNNPAIQVYGINYKESECEDTLQFRFYNSFGGYSYFYTPKEALKGSRSKSEFLNNAFYNQQENKPSQVQRSADYSETLNLSGVKQIELAELFRELLRSPKIEVNLPHGYTECEVRGDMNERPLDFEYTLIVTTSNPEQMTL